MQFLLEAQYLASSLDHGRLAIEGFTEQFSRLVAHAIVVQRASVWLRDPSSGPTTLVCAGSHDCLSGNEFHAVTGLTRAVIPRTEFLKALDRDGAVCAVEAAHHEATATMYRQVMVRDRVESMLSVPFSLNGELLGALTCVSIGRRAEWSPYQLATLKRLMARISPALARADDQPASMDLAPFWPRRIEERPVLRA